MERNQFSEFRPRRKKHSRREPAVPTRWRKHKDAIEFTSAILGIASAVAGALFFFFRDTDPEPPTAPDQQAQQTENSSETLPPATVPPARDQGIGRTVPVPATPEPTSPAPSAVLASGENPGDLWDANSLSMKFRWCPAGAFQMGSPEEEFQRSREEIQVGVKLTHGFWLGQYEVTQREYEKVMGSNPSEFQDASQAGSHPVEVVSWQDAVVFCDKFTQQEQQAGRLPEDWKFLLPTEAQWEYACRAGTETATHFGDSLTSNQANILGVAPYQSLERGPNNRETVPVGSYQPNLWNLYDMHGNVAEWCRDCGSHKIPGGINPFVSPEKSTFRKVNQADDEVARIYRGGSWRMPGSQSRSATRHWSLPTTKNPHLGFRVILIQMK